MSKITRIISAISLTNDRLYVVTTDTIKTVVDDRSSGPAKRVFVEPIDLDAGDVYDAHSKICRELEYYIND